MRRGCLFNHEQPENYVLRAHKKYTQVKLNQGGKTVLIVRTEPEGCELEKEKLFVK